MDRIKLKWTIFSFLLGFCALLLLLLWMFQTIFLYDMYKFVRTREIASAVTHVKNNIDSPELYSILDELLQQKEIIVTKTNEFVPPKAPPHIGGEKPRQERITKTEQFTLKDGRTLSLTFHAIITPVDATVSTLKMQLYIVTGIMILMSVLLAAMIAKKISTPLEDINNSAKMLAKGNYTATFYGTGFLEIKELSDTLNTAAKELAKVEELRRELLANVSHDLRTPLSLIYSYAEMMHDFPEEITSVQTKMIMDETKRLASLVNDVLDLSKLESAMEQLAPSDFSLTELLLETTGRTAELVKQLGYRIDFEYDSNCFVTADEGKITQAYYNLLLNAINHCTNEHAIKVRQTVEGDKVKIQIIDHGEGISEQELPYIWDRYYKSDKNHTRAVAGSGLGLSIVRNIFELHHAPYGVVSTAGEGSTFWFTLNLCALQFPLQKDPLLD